MRDIKFRAWHNQLEVMIPIDHQYQLNIRDKNWEITDLRIGCKVMDNWRDNDKGNILMQYTGLKDKNGKEIYEGDIIYSKNKYRLYQTELIEYREEHCGLVRWCIGADKKAWLPMFTLSPEIVKVIGNIYENGDLLKCE